MNKIFRAKNKRLYRSILVVFLLLMVLMVPISSEKIGNDQTESFFPSPLSIQKMIWNGSVWVDSLEVTVNDTIRFNLTISYDEDIDSPLGYYARNISVVDQLPTCLSYEDNADPLETKIIGNRIYWNLTENLTNGQKLSIEFDAQAICNGTLTNIATVSAIQNGTNFTLKDSDDALLIVTDTIQNYFYCEKLVWDTSLLTWVEELTVSSLETVRFNITFSYMGSSSLIYISVKDILPLYFIYSDNASIPETEVVGNTVFWNLSTPMFQGDQISIEFDAVYNDIFIDMLPHKLVNIANVTAFECGLDWVSCENNATIYLEPTQKLCQKQVKDTQTGLWVEETEAEVGDTVRFRIVITYWGNYTLYNIHVKDTLPPGLVYADNAVPTPTIVIGQHIFWNLTEFLNNGESIEIQYDALVNAAGVFVNSMELIANECNGEVHYCSDFATIIVNDVPKICNKQIWNPVTHTWVDELSAQVGDTIRFRITINYWGEYRLYNIHVKDILPDGLYYANNAIPMPSAVVGQVIYWNLSQSLYDGENLTIEFDALVISDGVQVNFMTVTANECSGNIWTCCDTATVIVTPGCKICDKLVWDTQSKQWVEETEANVGDTVRFRIVITYWGNYTLYNIHVKDTLPPGLEYENNADPNPTSILGSQILWDFPNIEPYRLSNGESLTIEFDVKVKSEGVHVNFMTVTTNECSGEIIYCSDSAIIDAEKDNELVADAGGPYIGFVGIPIKFTGSVIGGTPPYSYTWYFDDGQTSISRNPTHIYTTDGTFLVTFKVTDYFGFTTLDLTNTTIKIDLTPPTVYINKPITPALYIGNKYFPWFMGTVIIGFIDVEITTFDNETQLDHVNFYVDDAIKETISTSDQFIWTWSERVFGRHILKIVAIDGAGNQKEAKMTVWKFF